MQAAIAVPVNTEPICDAELVLLARQGDGGAFRTIMQRHNRRLYRVARSVLRDDSKAEDVVQEAYMRAFAGLAEFRGDSSLSTWLTRITINEALRLRNRQRSTVSLELIDSARERNGTQIHLLPLAHADNNPECMAAQREIGRVLERAIGNLPEPFRVVFVMRDVEEMSTEETATALGLRLETVRTRLYRARRLLRSALDKEFRSALKDRFPFADVRCARTKKILLAQLDLAAPTPRGTSPPS